MTLVLCSRSQKNLSVCGIERNTSLLVKTLFFFAFRLLTFLLLLCIKFIISDSAVAAICLFSTHQHTKPQYPVLYSAWMDESEIHIYSVSLISRPAVVVETRETFFPNGGRCMYLEYRRYLSCLLEGDRHGKREVFLSTFSR